MHFDKGLITFFINNNNNSVKIIHQKAGETENKFGNAVFILLKSNPLFIKKRLRSVLSRLNIIFKYLIDPNKIIFVFKNQKIRVNRLQVLL